MKFSTLFVALAATSTMTVASAQSDDCATPDTIAGEGTFAFDSTLATTGLEGQNETLCYAFGSSAVNSDIWFSWTASATGDVTVGACTSGFDTKIAAYPGGGCPTDGSALACNDDSCGLQSEISFPVTSGTAYMIQVGAFSTGGTGALDISIAVPANPDNCATPDVIAGQGLFAFDQTLATTGLEGQAETNCFFFGSSTIDSDVWFSWTADIDGTADIQTCGQTTVDTKLAVYPGGGCPTDGSSLACNDDNCGLQSGLQMPVLAGVSYMIQVGTYPGGTPGTGNLDISIVPTGAIAEDDCATPVVIAGQGNFAFDSTTATTGVEGQNETGCYFFGSSAVSSDVWYDWTANSNGTVVISMCGNTTVDTKIAAYPGGGCPTDGSSLACNDDTCGLQSEMSFAVTAGNSYMLQLGTYPGSAGGAGSFDIKIFTGDSDHCSTPDMIAGQGNFAYDSTNASTGLEGQAEVSCYFFGTSGIDNDVWFAWTADADGNATVSTCSSTLDTKIAAYDSACAATAAIACNDDDCGLQSSISFPVTNGTTYTLQVGNWPGASGGISSVDIVINPFPTGTAYCFGDGSGAAAPCGNLGAAGNGCANSAFAGGANLDATGDAVIGADTVVLTATDIPTGQPGLFFQGDTVQSLPFGDGIQCTGGNMVRLGVVFAFGGATSIDTSGLAQAISVKGGVAPGDLRQYQLWYRDPVGSPCGNLFNFTNGYEIQW